MKYAFLGFIKKNLKPKKSILGGKKRKTEKSEDVFGKEVRSFLYESVLIFPQKRGERVVLTHFNFFEYPLLKSPYCFVEFAT